MLCINLNFYIILLILLSQQIQELACKWEEPYFLNANTEGVTFLSNNTSLGIQMLNVREELPIPYKLVEINYKESVGTPTLGAFDIGDNSLLGAQLISEEQRWFIIIGKRQDYENVQQQIYFFQIYIKDSKEIGEQSIFITLKNIFDNQPLISYKPSPCRAEELQANYQTNCTFTVYDPDGMVNNKIRLKINNNQEKSLFEFAPYGDIGPYSKQYQLKILKALHYEKKAFYNLEVHAFDAQNNSGNIYAILEVIDVPNRPPVWMRPLTTATFNEKEEKFFNLHAIDGDTGINKSICYKLEFENDYSQFISINHFTGQLHVLPIDRDILNQEIFHFYTCAYKCDNSSWLIKDETILIVQDINDHKPEIALSPKLVKIPESKYLTVPLNEFSVQDLDLGSNASYTIYLSQANVATDYAKAFSLTPDNGYQRTNFSLNVVNTELLDYENEQWREFVLRIIAQEIGNLSHTTFVELKIELINWNDERPVFELELYEVSVEETITKGENLMRLQAFDRDIGDQIRYFLLGNNTAVAIDPFTGLISVSNTQAFDYERQSLLYFQVLARDSLITEFNETLHYSYAQLLIHIVDVNDETPIIKMPRFMANITENFPSSTLVAEVEAFDPDSTANLKFQINWSSSYATKRGQEVHQNLFKGCFSIQPVAVGNNLVYGNLKLNKNFIQAVDYEKYDTIFLSIMVKDLNQQINDGSATALLTIRVNDINDNAPEFVSGTLNIQRTVKELEKIGNVIGNIEAFDIDGPDNNDIIFELRPLTSLPATDLIIIENTTGILKVNGKIECDLPKIYALEFEVTVSDSKYKTKGKFLISIIDVNNRKPIVDKFPQQVFIYENATSGFLLGEIKAHDDDRDSPHNLLTYTIGDYTPNIYNIFEIDTQTGKIRLKLRNGFILDRDSGVTFYYIPIDIRDNSFHQNTGYEVINHATTFLNVTLLDVNDNAPQMPDKLQFLPEFSEANPKNTIYKADFIAIDRDEPNTLNSRITYKLLEIRPDGNNSYEPLKPYDDLFAVTTVHDRVGKLLVNRSLKGFYGFWIILIQASDHGIPEQKNISSYEVYVRPFNFHMPVIRSPVAGKTLRICQSMQEAYRPLYLADCQRRLNLFEAYDPDGNKYGDVTFDLDSDVGDDKHFQMIKLSRNTSALHVKKILPAGSYSINLRAIDGGGSSSQEIRQLKLVFVDVLGSAMFLEKVFQINFTENEAGLQEKRYVPEAYDPKNEGLETNDDGLYKLYYFIDDSIYPNDTRRFKLNPKTRELTLKSALDREHQSEHRLRIKVTNNPQGRITNHLRGNYTLEVIIKVNDVNDNSPKFSQQLYAAGLTNKDSLGKLVLQFQATDADSDDQIIFEIIEDSYERNGEFIPGNLTDFLILDKNNGSLNLLTYVNNNMKGYLEFQIKALDRLRHYDTAQVKIYIVSEKNRVKFVFLSDIEKIRDNQQYLREQFQLIYGYDICNIDAIEDITSLEANKFTIHPSANHTQAFITEITVHFIHDNEAVNAQEIERRANDLSFLSQLQNSLQQQNLILNNIPHEESITMSSFLFDQPLTFGLIICNILLGLVSVVVTTLHLRKIKFLKRELKAFETTAYGSIPSNLNRLQMGPAINLPSVEGTNPVLSEQAKYQISPLDRHEIIPAEESDDEGDKDELDDLHDDSTFSMEFSDENSPQQGNQVLNNIFTNYIETRFQNPDFENLKTG
ncbi:cadherin-AgCad1-like [Glossina fuscipes fuscipes]